MRNYWLPISLLACFCGLGTDAQISLFFRTTAAPSNAVGGTVPPTVASSTSNWVLVNNVRVPNAITPFEQAPPPTQEFLQCIGSCPTTPQYSPICASNRQLYLNEQKFNCARYCGADIKIVRQGSCEGLFQMTRG